MWKVWSGSWAKATIARYVDVLRNLQNLGRQRRERTSDKKKGGEIEGW